MVFSYVSRNESQGGIVGNSERARAHVSTLTLNRSHENIIAILDMIPPTSYETFTEVYLVQELMETDL